MKDTTTASTKHVWERWQPMFHRIFTALLLLSALQSQTDDQATLPTRAAILLLTVAFFGWYFVNAAPMEQGRLRHPLWLLAYFGIGWLIWYGLASLNAFFFFMLFVLFPYVFMVAPMPWSLVLLVALNALVLIALNRISSDMAATWMLILAFTSVGGGILGYFVQDIIRQSEERQQLITDLQTTRESLTQSQHEAGILSERQRLAGELHDTIAQGLIAIVTHLEAAENIGITSQHVDQAKTIARSSLQETRRFIWAMRSVAFEGGSFHDGLRYSIDTWSNANAPDGNLSANLVITGTVYPLNPQYEFTILRVIQESLANIARHAKASQATVTLSYTSGAILLDINDNGCGFNPDSNTKQGFGLINMRYRVEQLGGTLNIESEPNEGTTIIAHLPVVRIYT